MQQDMHYRYRIEHSPSRARAATPWRPTVAEAMSDRDYLYPEHTAWDFDRQAHVATWPDGREAFLFALETRRAGA